MSKFIEEFYYGNLDPQARSTKEKKTKPPKVSPNNLKRVIKQNGLQE